ncbi:peptidase, S41 family [Fimbriimonas ginsengisoli Gsoil 348]|uniref:Peptidase, S41 family n=1 Tax=Fimbriimonas ginsengisoli Gsoil 348 TaxID=661478 RepID=A0A068NXM2_FIMGI|nr:peptidase, S41 family [Fimbriimonas ginsengisoli Gsoil 348]
MLGLMRQSAFRVGLLLPAMFLALATGRAQTSPPNTLPNNPFVTGPEAPKTEPLTKERKEEILSELGNVVLKQAFVPGVNLSKWPEFLEKQREDIDKAEKDTDFARAVNRALSQFGVSHIRFLPPRAAQSRVRTSTIGIGVGTRPDKDGLTIMSVFPKSPAEVAGIKQGETIVSVDGKLPEASDALLGDEGTEMTLKLRDKDGKERELKIKRERYSTVREDTLTWMGDDTAVLKIHSFSRGYSRENIAKLMSEAGKAKYLVLDLRSNGGGLINNLQHLLNMLLPDQTVVGTFINRSEAAQYAENHAGDQSADPIAIAKEVKDQFKTRHMPVDPFVGKIAVLVNRGSASASEICAMALRENLGAPIVGAQSAGAVLASMFRRLPYGFEVQFPVSDYVSKNGVRLEKTPIVPDVEVTEKAEEGKPDPAIEKAIAKLKGV